MRTEWRWITMSHNLTKLHRHQIATWGLNRPPRRSQAQLDAERADPASLATAGTERRRLCATATAGKEACDPRPRDARSGGGAADPPSPITLAA